MTPRQILPILLTILLGHIGFSMVLPIFPTWVIGASPIVIAGRTFLSNNAMRLGILVAMYPLGQCISSPIFGKLSDRFGRRPVLLASLLGIIPSYFFTMFSIMTGNVLLVILSRFICGIFEGNMVIAQAAILDYEQDHVEKVRNFGSLIATSSIGFIIGPILGGILSNKDFSRLFNYSTPFGVAGCLSIVTFFAVFFLFSETKKTGFLHSLTWKKILSSYYIGFRFLELRPIYILNFFLSLSVFFFLEFFPAMLVHRFEFTSYNLGFTTAYLSIPIFLAPFLLKRIAKHLPSERMLQYTALLFSLCLILFLYSPALLFLFIALFFLGFCIATIFTFAPLLIATRVDTEIQGETLGLNQSVQVFSEAVAGIIGGILAMTLITLPIYLAGAVAGVCGLALFFVNKRRNLIH